MEQFYLTLKTFHDSVREPIKKKKLILFTTAEAHMKPEAACRPRSFIHPAITEWIINSVMLIFG